MAKLFEQTDGVVCRSCGAAHARPSRNAFPDVCDTCWRRFDTFLHDREPSEDLFNKWLARQLYLSAKRLRAFGITGRCEAITAQGALFSDGLSWRTNSGYQCGMFASMMRDGHRVCSAHGTRADTVQYVDRDFEDPYRVFSRLLADVALTDKSFFSAVKHAVECVEALQQEGKGNE